VGLLELRIDDKSFIRLIRKWLKAGILEPDGAVNHPEKGSPQGGIVSPILANIYLHHALDVWFEETVKGHCRGAAYLCRYADDFVCAFELEAEAESVKILSVSFLGCFAHTDTGQHTFIDVPDATSVDLSIFVDEQRITHF